MAVQTQYMTVEEFEQFAARPENEERLLEYIGGEIVEVVCNSYSSLVAANILFLIKLYLRESKMEAYVTGEAAGYVVGRERYIPDVGVILKSNHPEPPHETWIPYPPDLAVEVLSPTDRPNKVRTKIAGYWAAHTISWVIDPALKEIEVYRPGHPPQTLRGDGRLDGGDILPGFLVSVKDVFQV
jgi:Uma2 family endonuclease